MSFVQGTSGLRAAAQELGVIGNNVANASTPGFKSSSAQFADAYANSRNGIGTQLTDVSRNFSQGDIQPTGNALDLAINGNGFFRLRAENGQIVFSRNGHFTLDADGYLVNPQKQRLSGYAGETGTALTELRMLSANMPPRATTRITLRMNLNSADPGVPATPAFDPSTPQTYSYRQPVQVVDSLGNAHDVDLYFRKSGAGEWQAHAFSGSTRIGENPAGTLTFDTSGRLTSDTSLPLQWTPPGAAPINATLDMSEATQYAVQSGSKGLSQDGYAAGERNGQSIAGDGSVRAHYSNDRKVVVGRVALASFANEHGLASLGGNAFGESVESGVALIGEAGSGQRGTLSNSAIEGSNVDLAAELVNMIVAQRSYQANAQTIKAQDTVLQTIVNL